MKTVRAKRRNRGFTLAEMLIVVAIIAVLGGVSFIAVQRYQRSMAQLERDAIAKEIFVAAQNHLTVAESQGYLGIDEVSGFGTADPDAANAGKGVYYFTYNTNQYGGAATTALDLMLPFGAIDETVRLGGRYVIRYQRSPARVLDVFYCTPSGTRFGSDLDQKVLDDGGEDNKGHRRDCSHYGGAVVGWYGGTGAEDPIIALKEPTMVVNNAERLTVTVTVPSDQPAGTQFKLLLHGETSGANKSFELKDVADRVTLSAGKTNEYVIVLDDITAEGMHFAELRADNPGNGMTLAKAFIPGENITLQAITYNNTVISELPFTPPQTTNSLFGDGSGVGEASITAQIENIRHLENLDQSISSVMISSGATLSLTMDKAVQQDDLDWDGFKQAINGAAPNSVAIYKNGETAAATEAGCFVPVSPGYALTYEGNGNSVKGIAVNDSGDAGMFGELVGGSKVSDLELVNFSITTTGGNAGALAGKIVGTEISNVVAYHEPKSGTESPETKYKVQSTSGSAGGLVGTMEGTADKPSSVQKSAAALLVSGSNAGGLIGSASGNATISASFAGGHTGYTDDSGVYHGGEYDPANCNVTGNAAGGLVGAFSGTKIENCYTTCSVKGETAGGFVGTASKSMENCYATGLVVKASEAARAGAFAGTLSGGTAANCLYYEIINMDDEGTPMFAVGTDTEESSTPGISALDADAETFNDFSGGAWTQANTYDTEFLTRYYGNKYPCKTVEQLGAALKTDAADTTVYFVASHYGDWPSPEVFVVNTPS